MIRSDEIKSALLGGVGFRQSPIAGYAIVDDDNQISDSGLYYQDASNAVTIQNIKECQQNKDISDDDFNSYLTQLQESALITVCNEVVEKQSDFIQSNNIYPFEKTFTETQTKTGKFYGFRIRTENQVNLISRIPWIELSFSASETFNIYLFNSNRSAPIQTKEVTTSAGQSVIVDLGWYISDDTTYKGGDFYIGYFEDDIGLAEAYLKNYELSNNQKVTNCYELTPVTLDHTGTNIDISSRTDISDLPGMNIGFEIYNDYTELIIRNKNMFWRAIQLQMAEKVANLILTSVRSNRIERLTKQFIDSLRIELYGNRDFGILGIEGKLRRAISDLKKTFFYEPIISRRTLG